MARRPIIRPTTNRLPTSQGGVYSWNNPWNRPSVPSPPSPDPFPNNPGWDLSPDLSPPASPLKRQRSQSIEDSLRPGCSGDASLRNYGDPRILNLDGATTKMITADENSVENADTKAMQSWQEQNLPPGTCSQSHIHVHSHSHSHYHGNCCSESHNDDTE